MSRKKVSIGIPAHNEEANIESLLNALICQKEDAFEIVEIFVLGDGCTDSTEQIVSKFAKKNKKIITDFGKSQKGKQFRLNKFLLKASGDILVAIDADVLPKTNTTISELVSEFDQNVGLVAANDHPAKARSFFQHINSTLELLWFEIRKNINGGDSIHNQRGRMFGMSKQFAKQVKLPNKTLDDYYLYLSCKALGYKFKLAKEAVVLYNAPANFKDFLKQAKRNESLREFTKTQFDISLTNDVENIPRKNTILGLLVSLFKRPISTPLALILLYADKHIPSTPKNIKSTGAWDDVTSTKVSVSL